MSPTHHAPRSCNRRNAPRRLAAALAAGSLLTLGLAAADAQTLPSGLNVVQGQARVNTVGNQMTVTNSNGAILNWSSFSIGASNVVRFEQANASSQVLNRVLGNDPSNILGQLSSNGKVWLLNPNGVLFGQNARINVAGLVTSTLNLSDRDWTAGRYNFSGTGTADIVNQGELRTTLGGHVALVGASVRNEGLIEAPGGQILLAAGQSVELIDTGSPNLSVKVTAPQGQALNLGTLAAAGGRIDIHGAIVNQQGIVRADSLQGTGGDIVLRASQTLMLSADSRTSADGGDGGKGGQIQLLGRQVGLTDRAVVSASGAAGGGQVLVGGGQQGLDASVPNSEAVYFGKDASIRADATANGDGGRLILWSDKATRAYGSLSARGGELGGNGGFIETSGGWLDARPALVRTGAPRGSSGTWLLDPYDIVIGNSGTDSNFSTNIGTETSFSSTGTPSFILSSTINTALNGAYDGAGHIRIITTSGGAGNEAGNVTFQGATINGAYTGGSSLLVNAAGSITVNNSSFTNGSGLPVDTIKLLFDAGGNVSFSNVSMPKSAGLNIRGADVTLLNTNVSSQFIAIDIAATGTLTLGTSTVLSSDISGTAIRLQAAKFHNNNSGSQALRTPTPGSRWLVYGADPANGTDFAPGNLSYAFKQYGGGSVLGSGNGFIFSKLESVQLSSDPVQKVYDANTGVPSITNLQATPAVSGDKVGGTLSTAGAAFGNKNVGVDKAISLPNLSLSFSDASDKPVYGYTVAPLTGTITPATLIVSGVSANNKVYDGSANATFGGTPSYTVLGSDDVQITGLGSGTFFTKFVGTARPVQFFGFTTAGADVGNYNIVPANSMKADITPAPLLISGLSAVGKVYDGTTVAVLSGTASLSPIGADQVFVVGTPEGQFADKNVGTAIPVTASSGLTLGGADSFNYTPVLPSGLTADITRRPLQFSLQVANKVYDATTAATVTGQITSGLVSGESLGMSTGGEFVSKNVGEAIFVSPHVQLLDGAGGGRASNYVLDNGNIAVDYAASITPATLTLTGLTALNKVYDRTTLAPLAGQAGIAPLAGDEVTLQGSLSANFNSKNVGTAKPVLLGGLTLAGADAGNYVLALPQGLSADITPAALALTGLTAANKVYDAGTAATLSGTAQIAPQGQDQLFLNGVAAGNFADKNVGTAKPVTVSGLFLDGADAGNYSLQTSLSADITKRSLNINGLTVADKIYNASTAAQVGGTASVTPLPGDNVGLGEITGYGAQFIDKNAGLGKSVTVTPMLGSVPGTFNLSGADAGNYSVAPTLTLSANIAKADLAINGLQASSKIYDGTTAATLNTSGVVLAPLGNDQLSIASGASGEFANKNVGLGKAVNVTTFSLTGPDAANYNPVVPLTLFADITPRTVQLTGVSASSKVYDGQTGAAIAGGSVGSLVEGDQVALSAGTGDFSDKNVGRNKTVVLQGFGLSGADAGNYTLAFAGALRADITPASLSASGLTANSKVYDATTAVTLSGTARLDTIGGDLVTLSAGTASFVDKNVGTDKTVVLSGFGLGGADAGNYQLDPIANLSASITPAALTISGLTASNKVYDAGRGATLAGTAAVKALGNDSVSLGGSAVASFSDKNVGAGKSVSVTGYTLSGSDAANYTVAQPAGLSASITPATLVISGLGAADKVYDGGTAAELTGGANIRALGSDIVSVDMAAASARFANKNAGGNKSVSVANLALAGADAGNYLLQAPGNLTASIIPANVTLNGLTANNKVYDASTAASLSGSAIVDALAGDRVGLSGTAVARFSDKQAGTGKSVSVSGITLSGADAGNYSLVLPDELRADITPATLVISGLSANNKVYDATRVASLSGNAAVQALAGDSVVLGGSASASFADKNVGNGKSVSVSGFTLGGADAANYRVLAPSLTASITPASLQYLANPVSKAIGDAVPPLSGSVTGFVGGETQQTATTGTLSFSSSVDVQTPAGSYAVQGAGLAAQNYSFAQAPGNATALTVTGVSAASTLNQSSAVAANTVVSAPTITANSAAGGLLDLLQAPAAGSPAAAAAAPTAAAVAAIGSTSGTAATPSFSGMRLGDMSPDALAGMLASRDRYKKSLFADATARLEQNAALADLRICKTQAEVAAGDCLLTDELKRQLQAAKAAEDLAQMQRPGTPPDGSKTAAAQPQPKGLTINLGLKRRVKSAALPQIERKVAVVIGVDNYQDKSIPQLDNAVKDAQSVGSLFDGVLGYETVVIPNASKQAVVSALNKLALELGPRDSVVIYYAGHGELVESTGLGYWQLADADAKKPETWLSNADIGRMIAQIGASQVALISDSCYSGSLVSDERIRATPGGTDPQALLARKSVVVMSSGGNEPVSDEGKGGHSPFAWNLMNQLKQVNSWQAGGNVFERVRFAVARELPQRPKYGSSSAAGHQAGGDYLFEQRQLETGAQ
nr:YDG domain-containing protein [uncultured Roseateles sp.]